MIGKPLEIKDLISEMRRDGVQIPEIQRAYVWRRSQIAKLLDSLYRKFPTGSILLWDTQNPGVETREMGTTLGPGAKPDFRALIVLDGQQRLTSLGRVFDPKTPQHERILFNVETEAFEPYSPRQAADPLWIDTTAFLSGESTELTVIRRLKKSGVLMENDEAHEDRLHSHLKRLSAIREYQYPVEIVREEDLEVVTEIFIRVNSAGTRLREAELALARLAWKLPGTIVGPFEKLEDECRERGFDEIDTRFLMRALVSVATGQSRFKDLKAFWARPADEIEASRRKMERGLRNALDFVEGNVGIPGSALLPSHMSMIPLVVILATRDHLTDDESLQLRRWFLVANCFSRYVGASETTLNQDLTVLGVECLNVTGLMEQASRDLRGVPTIGPADLERAGTNSPLFPLSYLAAIQRNALDWFKGIKIRRESFSEDQQIEYHHIFPKKVHKTLGTDRYRRDEMANLAFLSQKANRTILAREPAVYLADIAKVAPQRLEAQFVPMDPALWQLSQFEDFLAERRRLLAAAMNDLLKE